MSGKKNHLRDEAGMSILTRQLGDGGWAAGCQNNPPPLHVYDTESAAANWYPYVRPVLRPAPPGPTMVQIPQAAPFGDDPTDPASQTIPRVRFTGMIGRPGVNGL